MIFSTILVEIYSCVASIEDNEPGVFGAQGAFAQAVLRSGHHSVIANHTY